MPELIANGRVIRPDIGITRIYETDRGLVIVGMVKGGPAERAGLRGFRIVREQKSRGPFVYTRTRIDRSYADLIIAVDGKKVASADELLTLIEKKHPGDQMVVTVIREDRQMNITVQLGAGE